VRGKSPQEDYADQSGDHSVHPQHAPQNAQGPEVSLHSWEVHRHEWLCVHRLSHNDLRPAFRTKMNTFRHWSSTCLTDHLTLPNT
jgi:hypothetical protein